MGENSVNDKLEKQKQYTKNAKPEHLRAELRSIPSANQPRSNGNTSTTIITSNENKKCWPNSAIDEELCKELENYKNSDVPVIHAFVLPTKLSNSVSSPVSDEKYSQDASYTMVPESVAVPVPILNTLLDRILQTMLDS